jgi:hypothetical protein
MKSYWFARIYDPLVEPVLHGLNGELTNIIDGLPMKHHSSRNFAG